MPPPSVNTANLLKYALEGRIVTMDDHLTVIDRGRIFVNNGNIVDVRAIGSGFPPDFSAQDIIKTGGTIYPGMIELHNHLPYNILPFWLAPGLFRNHTQWKGKKEYRQYITGPMQTLGKTPGFPAAIIRYVECKSLLSGVTTSQGITLANSTILQRYYHGLIRNVEETNEAILPEAEPRIADVDDPVAFKASIVADKTKLLHLSEGVDEKARSFFTNLYIEAEDDWAITNRLAGIHCTGLLPEDFEILGFFGGSMVWSPFSNLILYGDTAKIKAAKEHNIRIALGSDWSPSGSKNLLEELKVAKLFSDHHEEGPVFSNEELVQMVTINPASILGWDEALGSIVRGKKADFLILSNYQDDPYEKLIGATEKNLSAVIINGLPRCGRISLMHKFNLDPADFENLKFDGSERVLYLKDEDADEVVAHTTLQEASNLLSDGLNHIKVLAERLESQSDTGLVEAMENPMDLAWFLVPDFHDSEQGEELVLSTSLPFSKMAVPIPLDKLTVIADNEHFRRMGLQPNLPDFIKENLPLMYGRAPLAPVELPHS